MHASPEPENLKGLHTQEDTPVLDAANFPAPQSAQVEATVAPTAAEYFPATQSAQLEEPADAWNLPAGHDVHAAA